MAIRHLSKFDISSPGKGINQRHCVKISIIHISALYQARSSCRAHVRYDEHQALSWKSNTLYWFSDNTWCFQALLTKYKIYFDNHYCSIWLSQGFRCHKKILYWNTLFCIKPYLQNINWLRTSSFQAKIEIIYIWSNTKMKNTIRIKYHREIKISCHLMYYGLAYKHSKAILRHALKANHSHH